MSGALTPLSAPRSPSPADANEKKTGITADTQANTDGAMNVSEEKDNTEKEETIDENGGENDGVGDDHEEEGSNGEEGAYEGKEEYDEEDPVQRTWIFEDMEADRYTRDERGHLSHQYLVRWSGNWPANRQRTWEPEQHIPKEWLLRYHSRSEADQTVLLSEVDVVVDT